MDVGMLRGMGGLIYAGKIDKFVLGKRNGEGGMSEGGREKEKKMIGDVFFFIIHFSIFQFPVWA